MPPLIINRPDLLSLRRHYADNLLKLGVVLTWLYLLMPLLTLFNWYLAYTFFNQHLILLGGYQEYKTATSVIYLLVIGALLMLVLLWAGFGPRLDRKLAVQKQGAPVSLEQMSAHFALDREQVEAFRGKKNLVAHFDQQGQLIDFSVRAGREP